MPYNPTTMNFFKFIAVPSSRMTARKYVALNEFSEYGSRFFPVKSSIHFRTEATILRPYNGNVDGQLQFNLSTSHDSSSDTEIFENIENTLRNMENVPVTKWDEAMLSNCTLIGTRLSEDQILKLFAGSNRVPVSDSLLSFESYLENECIRRAGKWDVETFLKFFKQYREVGFIRNSKFPAYALRSRSKFIFNRCSLPIVVNFLSQFVGTDIGRRARFNRHDLEYVLNKNFHNLRSDEVVLFIELLSSCGKNLSHDRLKKSLCMWFEKEAGNLTDEVVRKFLTLFHGHDSKNPLFITPWLIRVLKIIEERLEKFDLKCVAVVASICLKKMIFDEGILDKISSKFLTDSWRTMELYDLETIVEALASCNYQNQVRVAGKPDTHLNMYEELVRQMSREPLHSRLRKEPKVLCRILALLSLVNVYPYNLLSLNFSKKTLSSGYKNLNKYNIPPEIRLLVGGMRLECLNYKGCKIGFNLIRFEARKHRLSFPKVLTSISDHMTNEKAPRELSPYNRVLYSARMLFNHLLGGSIDYTRVCFMFPHSSKANILFCTRRTKEPRPLPLEAVSKLSFNHQNTLLDSDVDYYVVLLVSKNIYADYKPVLLGEEIAKARQLKNLGFETVFVVQHGWFKLHVEDRLAKLKDLLLDKGIILPK